MKGQYIPYSPEERAFLAERATLTRRELHAAFVERFARTDVSQENLTAMCKRQGWLTGRDGRFAKGCVTANKGKPMPRHPNCVATQFHKGHLPHNTRYAGHERVSKDGYIEISINEPNPHTGFGRRYILKHLHLWQQANGKLPRGMCLKCLDGNKQNLDLSNWQAVPRALLPRLNGRYGRNYDAAPAELKPAILAVTKLEHAVRERAKGAKHG